MNVSQVAPYFYPHYGGSERFCYEVSKRLSEDGFSVSVHTTQLYSGLKKKEEMEGFMIYRYRNIGSLLGINPVTPIVKGLLNCPTDIIHAHSYVFFTSNQAAMIKLLKKTPFLLHIHGGVSINYTYKGLVNNLKYNKLKKIYDYTLGYATLKTSNIIASVSRADIETLRTRYNIDEERFVWIPNGVDVQEYKNRRIPQSKKYILYIGRLDPIKGIDVLLKTAKKFHEMGEKTMFYVAGRGTLKNFIENTKTPNIKFLGSVSEETKRALFCGAEAFFLPSYSEGLPTVLLESFAASTPVVASSVGGVPEVVVHGNTGFTFTPGNYEQAAKYLIDIASDRNLRDKMGGNGNKLIRRYYNWDDIVEKVKKVYKTLAEA